MVDFPKGVLMNLVLKYVRKAIPSWSLDGVISLK
jgi:hypothetical protein